MREAFALNSPLCRVDLSSVETKTPRETGFVTADGVELALSSLKRAEAGGALILRLYEPHGARGTASLRFGRRVKKAGRTNLLEDPPVDELYVEDEVVRFEMRPFEVITLRLEFGNDIR